MIQVSIIKGSAATASNVGMSQSRASLIFAFFMLKRARSKAHKSSYIVYKKIEIRSRKMGLLQSHKEC